MNAQDARRVIGRNVRAELARAGRTQKQAAGVLGLRSQSAMSERISGQQDFTLTETLALAAWLDVPLSEFLRDVYVDTTPGSTNSGTDKNLKWLTPLRSHVPTLLRTIAPFLPAEVPRAA